MYFYINQYKLKFKNIRLRDLNNISYDGKDVFFHIEHSISFPLSYLPMGKGEYYFQRLL